MFSIKYSVNTSGNYHPPAPYLPSIASAVFKDASAFRTDQRRRLEVEFFDKEQKLKTKLRVVTDQRDTCVQYALQLEDELAASKAFGDYFIVITKDNDELRATIDEYQKHISEQAAHIDNLNNAQAAGQETIKKLRGKRSKDRLSIESWQNEIQQLNDANKRLDEQNSELSSTIVKKDRELVQLQEQYVTVITARKTSQEDAIKHKETLDFTLSQLKDQKSISRKLASTLRDKEKSWKARSEELTGQVKFAQAETFNNFNQYHDIIREKDKYIKHLDGLNRTPNRRDHMDKHFQRLIKDTLENHQQVSERDRSNKLLKTDLQNLLAMKQQVNIQMNAYMKESRELRAKCNETDAKVEQLQGQLHRTNIFVAKLQNIITCKIDTTQTFEDNAVPIAVVKAMIAEATAGFFVEKEALCVGVQQAQTKLQELQITYDKCDDDLFEYHLEEQVRQEEIRDLRLMVSTLKEQNKIFEERDKVYSDCLLVRLNSHNVQIKKMAQLVHGRLDPLYAQIKQLLAEKASEKQQFEHEKISLQATTAHFERRFDQYSALFLDLQILYWDIAVHQHDRLHEELAKYKRKCGEEHYVFSRPASRLVHERRLLQYALAKTDGMDKNLLPREYFDPDFIKTLHPAVTQALQKLWPDLWQCHEAQAAAWIPISAPIMTNDGPIFVDEDIYAASNRRLEVYEEEAAGLEANLEKAFLEKFGLTLPKYGRQPASGSQLADGSDSDDQNSGSNDPAVQSGSSPSTRTNDSSPTHSVTSSGEVKDTHCVGSTYDEETKELMTEEEYDKLPAFAKKKAAIISAQVKEIHQLSGHAQDNAIDEDEFLSKYGCDIESINGEDRNETYQGCKETNARSSTGLVTVGDQDVAEQVKEYIDPLAWEENPANFRTEWEYAKLSDEEKRKYKAIVAIEAAELAG